MIDTFYRGTRHWYYVPIFMHLKIYIGYLNDILKPILWNFLPHYLYLVYIFSYSVYLYAQFYIHTYIYI